MICYQIVLPVSLLVRLTNNRPTWKIHAFSRAHNSVVSLLLSNIPSDCTSMMSIPQEEYYALMSLKILQNLIDAFPI